MDLIFREIGFGTQEYQKAIQLREEVLRKPLGLQFQQEQLEREGEDHHLCVLTNDEPLACLVLSPTEADDALKMRQVAVSPDYQKNGIGTLLVAFAEGFAVEKNCKLLMLHAREESIPFYKKLGYKIYDEPFQEVGIPHRKMRKLLRGS